MFYLYHGDDAFESRQSLVVALKDYPEVKRFEKEKISLENLATSNAGLFDQLGSRALLLEKLFSLPTKNFKKVLDLLKKISTETDVFIWEDKKITASKISSLGKEAKAFIFKIPLAIFKFLDSIGKIKIEEQIKYLDATIKTHPPELIFFLLERRFRELLQAKSDPGSLKMAPWQKSQLISQSGKLSLEEIKRIYLELIEIEWSNKTGRLGNSLKNELFNLVISY